MLPTSSHAIADCARKRAPIQSYRLVCCTNESGFPQFGSQLTRDGSESPLNPDAGPASSVRSDGEVSRSYLAVE